MLVCDDRGHDYLRSFCDRVERLPKGDVWIYKKDEEEPSLKFEIKSIGDFWNRHTAQNNPSISLNEQIRDIDGIVVIMDEQTDMFDTKLLMNVFNGVNDHHRVYQVQDVEHLGEFLKRREKKLNEGMWSVLEIRKPRYITYPAWAEALTNIDGVGPKNATGIYNRFDDIYHLWHECNSINNTPTDSDKARLKLIKKSKLCEVEKIGPTKAQKIIDFMLEHWETCIMPEE